MPSRHRWIRPFGEWYRHLAVTPWPQLRRTHGSMSDGPNTRRTAMSWRIRPPSTLLTAPAVAVVFGPITGRAHDMGYQPRAGIAGLCGLWFRSEHAAALEQHASADGIRPSYSAARLFSSAATRRFHLARTILRAGEPANRAARLIAGRVCVLQRLIERIHIWVG